MPTSDLANEPDETRDCASATDDRNTRHPAAVSRAAARTAPSPSFHFLLDERKAARAASKSDAEVDGGLRVQVRAPRPRCRLEGASGASIEAGEAENRRHDRRAGAAPHLLNERRRRWRLHHPEEVTWVPRSDVEKVGWLVRLPSFTIPASCRIVTWFFTWPNFVGLLVGIGSGTLFTTAGAASAATHPPLHEDAVKRAHGPR